MSSTQFKHHLAQRRQGLGGEEGEREDIQQQQGSLWGGHLQKNQLSQKVCGQSQFYLLYIQLFPSWILLWPERLHKEPISLSYWNFFSLITKCIYHHLMFLMSLVSTAEHHHYTSCFYLFFNHWRLVAPAPRNMHSNNNFQKEKLRTELFKPYLRYVSCNSTSFRIWHESPWSKNFS